MTHKVGVPALRRVSRCRVARLELLAVEKKESIWRHPLTVAIVTAFLAFVFWYVQHSIERAEKRDDESNTLSRPP